MGRAGIHNKRAIGVGIEHLKGRVMTILLARLENPDEDIQWDATKIAMPYLFPKLTTTMLQGDKANPVVLKVDKDDICL